MHFLKESYVLSRKTPQRKPAKKPLRFDFAKVARKAGKDHPALAKSGLFVDAANDDYIGSPRVFRMLEEDDDAMDDIQKNTRLARKLKSSFHQAIPIDSKNYIYNIVFYPDKYPLYDPADKTIDAIGTIDHETAHALHPDANGIDGENTADAYAVLRHLQRYKDEKTNIDYAAWKRALVFMQSGITTHITTFTIDKILLDSKSRDFCSLSPAETSAIARDYARKHTPAQNRVSKLSQDFKAVKGHRFDEKMMRKIADITLKAAPGSDTFYIGNRVLQPLLAGAAIKIDGKTVQLKDTSWENIRRALQKKATLAPKRAIRRSPPAA